MIKCDVHVHSIGSDGIIPSNLTTKRLGIKESYVDAEHQYRLAKRNGMGLVTLSDHNSISEAKKLVELHPEDTFMSCEYFIAEEPGGQNPEVLVLDVDEYLHKELDHVRGYGIDEFMKVVKAAKKPHSGAHLGYPANPKGPKLTARELDKWSDLVDVMEGLTGDSMRVNEIDQIVAKYKKKPMSGGSDDHAGMHTGRTCTVAPDAESKEDFLKSFSEGRIYPEGEQGSIDKFYSIITAIGRQFADSERLKRREMGFMNYFLEDKLKAFMLIVSPPFFRFYFRAAARKTQEALERRSSCLEREYLELVMDRQGEIFRQKTKHLKRYLDSQVEDLFSMIRPHEEYIHSPGPIERIANYVLSKSDSVVTEFDSV